MDMCGLPDMYTGTLGAYGLGLLFGGCAMSAGGLPDMHTQNHKGHMTEGCYLSFAMY